MENNQEELIATKQSGREGIVIKLIKITLAAECSDFYQENISC
jgi:hypothetical protein